MLIKLGIFIAFVLGSIAAGNGVFGGVESNARFENRLSDLKFNLFFFGLVIVIVGGGIWLLIMSIHQGQLEAAQEIRHEQALAQAQAKKHTHSGSSKPKAKSKQKSQPGNHS